jgi:hypothetical protein
MKIIDITQLNLISGGLNTVDWHTAANNTMTTAIATAKPVVNFKQVSMPKFVNNMLMMGNWHRNCAIPCKTESPKNGDRNALGQQYSWGTWWDDVG